jgi:uncharacterized protein YxjI
LRKGAKKCLEDADKIDVKDDAVAAVTRPATRCEKNWYPSGMIFAQGQKTFKVDGKALRVRDTLNFEDRNGNVLVKIQERKLRVKDSMEVEDTAGKQVAMVKKAIISPVRDRWTVKIKGGSDLEVQGNILDHEYSIGEGRDKVAEVSKKWFRVRDSYGVEIDPSQDDIVILAVTVCIDQMAQ